MNQIATSGAPKGKGGTAEAARPIQDLTMLKVAERPAEGNSQYHTMSDLHRAQVWLDSEVTKVGKNVTGSVVRVTPELAEVLLGRNGVNRAIKEARVNDYANDILAGNWKVNGEPLIVSTEGMLIDGQHRCTAVIQTMTATDMLMVFGVPYDTRDTVDHGTARSPGDDLALHGHHNTTNLAAAVRMVWQWREYGTISRGSKRTPTRMELIQTADGNPGIESALSFVMSKGKTARAVASFPLLAFCLFAFKTVATDEDVRFFFDALIEGNNLQHGDPILVVRNRLIAERYILKSADKAELLFRAWNAHRRDESRFSFRLTGGDLLNLEA